MNKYIAINIGPIVDTLSMVRRPRHLWSASYLFSHLMSVIITEATKECNKLTLVSPATITDDKVATNAESKAVVGLYPDRAFFQSKGVLSDDVISKIISNSYQSFYEDLKKNTPKDKREKLVSTDELKGYINIMGVQYDSNSESEAIIELNKQLDALELAVRQQPHSIDKILDLITPHDGWSTSSPLFSVAKGRNSMFKIKTIEEVAQAQGEVKFSHHRYFCVVQADGDSMGGVIKNLQEGKLTDLSKELIDFGKAASGLIENAGGIPIYAGGDDLLFIAPIKTNGGATIFDLINEIDVKYKKVQDEADKLQKPTDKVQTSMSYGVAMSFQKHPLYEVQATARHLLFDVAKKSGKNCISLELRKHSGSSLQLTLSKGEIEDDPNAHNFMRLCKEDQSETMVSAVAHKLRRYSSLFMSLGNDRNARDRISVFFDKYMSMDDKGVSDNNYISVVKDILGEIYRQPHGDKDHKEYVEQSIYTTLRVAKFIKGEEKKEE